MKKQEPFSMKRYIYFSLLFLFVIPTLVSAQKLLDPTSSSGPMSAITATSSGVNSSIAVAYSIRQLKTTYDHNATITPPATVSGFTNSTTPLARVRRSTDNGQLDIGYDGNGNLDSVTLKNFVSNNGVNPSASGYITVWYDQSGNSRDAFQTNTAQQFLIVSNGVLQRSSSGQVGFGGVSGGMLEHQVSAGVQMNELTSPSGINIYGIDSNRTLNVVSQPKAYTNGMASDGAGTYLIDRNGSTGNQDAPLSSLKAVSGNWTAQIRNITNDISSSFQGSIAISTTRSDNVTLTRTGNVYAMYVNGVLSGSNTLVGENKMTPIRIGYGTNTSEDVYYGEFTLFPSSLSSADLAVLNNSQSTYFVLGVPNNTWTGATSNAWALATNWSGGVIPDAITTVTIPSGTTNAPTISTAVSVKKITIASGATLTLNNTLSISDSLIVNGTLSGTGTVNMNGGGKQIISGTTSPIVFNNLTINNIVDTVVSNNNINVAGTLTINATCEFSMLPTVMVNSSSAAGTITGSGTVIVTRTTSTPDFQSQYKFTTNTLTSLTICYGGTGAQNINLGLNHSNITIAGSGTKTLSAAVTSTNVTGNILVSSGTLDNGGFAMAGAAAKTLSVSNGAGFTLSGTTSTFPTVYSISFGTTSTVTYSGSGAQTISAQSYGNLISSNSGSRTLASSGTIGIYNTFTPGSNTYTITSSTIDYNGVGAQTITAFNYNNLTISNTRTGSPTITLASGTVNVAGTFSITTSGVGSYSVSGNTVNMSGATQTVPSAIAYNNLTLSGSGSDVTTSVTVNGVMSMEGTASASAAITYGANATLQYNKSGTFTTTNNEWPATFNGTGGVIITNTGVITINAAKAVANTLAMVSGSSLRFNAVTTHTAGALTLAGTGQVSGTWGGTGSSATNTNSTYFGSSVTGRITIAGTTATWTGTTSTAWGTNTNWSTNAVPGNTTNVVIPSAPSNQPSITASASCLDITINSGATLTASNTLNIYGDFINNGTASLSNSPIVLAGSGTQSIDAFTTTGAITVSNVSAVVTLNGVSSGASLTFTGSGSTLSVSNSLTLSGALTLNSANGSSTAATIQGAGTISCASVAVGTTVTPSSSRTTTLTSTLSNLTISGNLTLTSFRNSTNNNNPVFTHTSGTLTIGGSLTTSNPNAGNTSTYTMGNSSPVLNLSGATPFSLSGTGTNTMTLNGTGAVVNYNSTSAQSALATTYTTLKVNNTTGVTLLGASTITNLTIGDLTSNSIFNDGGFVITPGTSPTLTLTSGTYNLGSATVGTSWPSWTTATLSSGTTVGYISAVAQSVSSSPSYKNLTFTGAGTKTIASATTLSVAGNWSTTGGLATFTSTANATVTGNISGSGSITVGSGTISIGGTWSNNGTFTPGTGTVDYNGTLGQTVAALNYTNLTVSNARIGLPPLILASGTIGVSGTFSYTATGFNGFTNTGNTVNFNGTGAQTITAINYNNLTISGARTGSPNITLANSTIGIAGTFTTSATGVGSYVTTSSTIDYNGSGAQTITPFSYANINLSGTRSSSPSITLGSGTINVSGTFNYTATGLGAFVNTGNTFVYNGTGAQTITNIDYNNLTISTARTGSPAITLTSGTIGIAGTFSITATGIGSYVTSGNTINYNAAGGSQSILNTFTYEGLSLGNTSGTSTAAGSLTSTGTFTTTAGGTLDMSTNTLTVSTVSHSGILKTQNTSSTPITLSKTWGGTVEFNGTSQTIPVGTYSNITCSNSGTKTMGSSITANGTVALNGTAKLSIGANTLTINGDFTSVNSSATLIGSKSSNLSIGGSGALSDTFYFEQSTASDSGLNNLTINRSSGTMILGNKLKVFGDLTPTLGTVASGGFLVLASNSSGTANILSGSGSVTGTVIVQRYIPSSGRRWRFLSSPVSNTTIGDWKNEIHITGTGGAANGFDATISNKAGIYSYDETVAGVIDNGWVAPANGTTTALTVGKGYRVFVRGTRDALRLSNDATASDSVTLDVQGTVNSGNITMPVSYTTTAGGTTADGWSLVGNPYPSAIDWNAYHDAGRTGSSPDYSGTDYAHLDATAYIFDPSTNSYVNFNATSTGTGSFASGLIPSGAAFFVKATTATGLSMTMKETYKSSVNTSSIFKAGAPADYFRIKLVKDSLNSDELVLAYKEDAKEGIDGYDTYKFYGPEVNIATMTNDASFLSVNFKPFNGKGDTIKLSMGIANSGDYNFEFKNIEDLASSINNASVTFIDKFLNKSIDIKTTNSYSFSADKNNASSWGNDRFMLVIGEFLGLPNLTEIQSKKIGLFPTIVDEEATISSNFNIKGVATISVFDITGKQVLKLNESNWDNNQLHLNLSSLKTGAYFIEVMSSMLDTSVVLKCIKK